MNFSINHLPLNKDTSVMKTESCCVLQKERYKVRANFDAMPCSKIVNSDSKLIPVACDAHKHGLLVMFTV